MRRSREFKSKYELALRFSDYEFVLKPDGTTRKRRALFKPNVKLAEFALYIKSEPTRRRSSRGSRRCP